ncbi:hypothetical protein LJC32_01175 [Oscillospiraceae bacterium OttesenSCG-928-F05]|nr:hypothetical protein [Oscillospiraceae bacterium OttesenSCG-928-F05]
MSGNYANFKPGDQFTHDKGFLCTVIERDGPDTLFSYEANLSDRISTFYCIAWKVYEASNGRYVWEQGHYYQDDLQGARRALKARSRERAHNDTPKFIQEK